MDDIDRATASSRITPNGNARRLFISPVIARRATLCLSLLMCALALAYLLLKITQLSALPAGYDFRFIWVAGDMWHGGINPYGPTFLAHGEANIEVGHVPVLWPYPPTWWIFAAPLGALDLNTASVVWNIFGLVIVIATCGMLTSAFTTAFPRRAQMIDEFTGGQVFFPLFSVVFFLLAILEATAILFSVGQTTLIAGLGIAVMLWSRVGGRLFFEAVGLTLVLLKPQIGAPFVVLYLLFDAHSRKVVLMAVLLSALLTVPSLLVAPSTILDFFRNLAAYDGFTIANLPQSMTGLRLIIWEVTDRDIGSSVATIITLVIIVVLCHGSTRLTRACDANKHTWQVFGLACAAIVALAPLHIYDFVLLAAPLTLLFRGRIVSTLFAGLGAMLIWRSENLVDIWAFHVDGVEIFPSSRLATIGALLFLIAVVDTVLQLNRQKASASNQSSRA
ncbi:glycosyltransferase family 87 protein [Ruegeria atlantica]|uniref:glycosyltransferase family 87 protein n=1 Tax=Ruegeria atlantica TaxID=81569 RepID=UPI00147E74EF|nr:glycosyltransferase family 87 protein [Ruegeria atlantica]